MKLTRALLASLFIAASLCGWARADDYYVDAAGGFDGGTNAPETPWATIDYAIDNGFASEAGDTLHLSGTFYEQIRLSWQAGHVCSGLTIKQWEGMPQAVIRGDTPTEVADWNETSTNTVYEYTLNAGTVPYWVNTGDANKHYTLREGIVSVTINWDTSIDQYGRHYGHLAQSDQIITGVDGVTALATVLAAMDDQTWLFIPNPVAASGGGGGKIYIKLAAYADDAALDLAAPQINYVIGNRNGIEIGTPTYTTYPTWGAYDGRNVTNCTIDGLHVYLWCDSGYRKNKPASTGQGDDNTSYDGGNQRGTVSVGYGIRPADWTGGNIKNVVLKDCGYHSAMYVGDHCTNNRFENIVAWGGGVNPYSGGSTGAFYTGPGSGLDNNNSIRGCVAERYIAHRYTLLGTDGACIPSPIDGTDDSDPIAVTYCSYDGMLIHTNARSGSIASAASGTGGVARIRTSVAHSMYDGERLTVEGSSVSAYNGTWTIDVIDADDIDLIGTTYSASATATYFSASNVVEDVEFRDCKDIQVGDLTTHTTCPGSAYIGGARSNRASDPTNWRTYPIRHIGCEQIGGATNVVSNETDIAFFRSRFELPRAGVDAGGPAMGSNSGYQNMNFTACEIVANLGHTSGTREIFKLNFENQPNKAYFIGTSVYNTTERATVSSQWFFTIQNDVTGTLSSAIADRVYARQTVFAHQLCTSTTDTGGPTRGFIYGGGINWSTYNGGTNPSVPFNIRDCMYANIQTTQWITWGGAGTSYGAQSAYTSAVDPNGIYLGQDPTGTTISTSGVAQVMPFADASGRSLQLTGAALRRTKFVYPNCGWGFNTSVLDGSPLHYSLRYGAWQDGPSQTTYQRARSPSRN